MLAKSDSNSDLSKASNALPIQTADFDKQLKAKCKEIRDEKQKQETEKPQLEQEKLAFHKMEISATNRKDSKKIKLNVGGKVFCTTLNTLLKQKDSFFGAMFSGRYKIDPDEDGEYFIDRSYTHFDKVLNYLRTDMVVLPERDEDIKELLVEVEFYQIRGLLEIVRNRVWTTAVTWGAIPDLKASGIALTNDNFTASLEDGSYGCVLSNQPITQGRQYFDIKLDHLRSCNRVGVVEHIPESLDSEPSAAWLLCPVCGIGYGYLSNFFRGLKCKQGDHLGMAIDMDNKTLTFYKNNTSMGVAATWLPKQVYIIATLTSSCKRLSIIPR